MFKRSSEGSFTLSMAHSTEPKPATAKETGISSRLAMINPNMINAVPSHFTIRCRPVKCQ